MYCSFDTNKCAPLVALGASCTGGATCVAGAYCDSNEQMRGAWCRQPLVRRRRRMRGGPCVRQRRFVQTARARRCRRKLRRD